MMRDIAWIVILVWFAYVVGSMTLETERQTERQRIVNACATDMECQVITDVLERMGK